MSNLEHYFENLLFYGEDIKGEANKNALTEEQQIAVEQCAQYVIYSMFGTRERFDEWRKHDTVSPWHRVEEELPSMDGYDWVLGIVTGEAGYLRFHKAVMMVSFDPQYKEWFIDEYPDARITVSHWMLLPEPPKEDA